MCTQDAPWVTMRSMEGGATHVLLIPSALRARIEDSARLAYPREACGFLIGRRTGDHVEVVDLHDARNLAGDGASNRFLADPLDHLAAEDEARAHGLEVVGVWHSHPDEPARLSELDRAGAQPGWSHAILSIDRAGATELRSWKLVEARFIEENLRN